MCSVFVAEDGVGGSIPGGLGWYDFTGQVNEGPRSYLNFQSKRVADNPRGVMGVEYVGRRVMGGSYVGGGQGGPKTYPYGT